MSETHLGELELLVLLAALRLGQDEAYAVSIVDEIRAEAGRRVQRATVYVVLRRLEQKGLIETHLGASRPERGGRSRRLVRVTAEGVRSVRAVRDSLRSMWDDLDAVLELGS